jgi:hypothetical protein
MDGNLHRASHWLARGVELQRSVMLARCNTYGFPEEVRSWIDTNKDNLTSSQWWREEFVRHQLQPQFERLMVYVCYMAYSLGSREDVKLVLARLTSPEIRLIKKLLLMRIPKALAAKDRLIKIAEDAIPETVADGDLALQNLTTRLFTPTSKLGWLLSEAEVRQLEHHPIYGYLLTPQFEAICRSMQLILRKNHVAALAELDPALSQAQVYLQKLDERKGPRKIFFGGFGWSGSSALFDAFRGYSVAKEMPGVGLVPFLNEGADSEPMIYQGPASVDEWVEECSTKGALSTSSWETFFRLYVLCSLHKTYFEYKTVNANRLLRETLGIRYYDIIVSFLRDYCIRQTTVVPPAIPNGYARVTRALNRSRTACFGDFSERIVKALFDDSDVVLFNNAIGTNNVHLLQHIPGEVVFIAVNRSMLDQMADQRRQNVFFKASAKEFASTKQAKLKAYRDGIKSVLKVAPTHRFIDIFFENWVTDENLRKATAEDLLGHYAETEERAYFDPNVSQKNVGIYPEVLTAEEIKYLTAERNKNPDL